MTALFLHITEERLAQMRLWEKSEAAAELHSRAIAIERQEKQTYVELGLIVCEIEDHQLWSLILDSDTGKSFTSLDSWMISTLQVCRASAYAAKSVLRSLKGDVSVADLEKMPRFAINRAAKLPPKRRKEPRVIEALQTKTEVELDKFIKAEIPEAHLESHIKEVLRWEESQKRKIDEAISLIGRLHDIEKREECFEVMAAEYLLTHEDELKGETV